MSSDETAIDFRNYAAFVKSNWIIVLVGPLALAGAAYMLAAATVQPRYISEFSAPANVVPTRFVAPAIIAASQYSGEDNVRFSFQSIQISAIDAVPENAANRVAEHLKSIMVPVDSAIEDESAFAEQQAQTFAKLANLESSANAEVILAHMNLRNQIAELRHEIEAATAWSASLKSAAPPTRSVNLPPFFYAVIGGTVAFALGVAAALTRRRS